ncbi:MAG: NAD(P)/FAD-dependent oxidoreductase, partial [Verrucomicrobiaceae bacterium]
LMERQLDADAASLLRMQVERKGIDVRLNASTAEILGDNRVEGIRLADGTEIATDAVIFSAGIRPNAGLAQAAGVAVNRGIVVDDQMASETDGVYALGECAEHRGTCYGLVEPTYEQATVLSDVLSGRRAAYKGSVVSTNLKVSGCNVFSAGDFLGAGGTENLVFNDRSCGIYKKLLVSGNRLTGAVLIGDTEDAIWYLSLIRSGADIGRMRSDIMFGPAIAERKAA